MLKCVIYPLYVPEGNYCYQGITEDGDDTMCPHLVFSGGHATCLQDFEPEKENNSIKILKDVECLELENM